MEKGNPCKSWKRSVFIPIPKKGNAKECSNYHTIVIFIGRTDAKAEAPILWPPDVKNCSLEMTFMLGKIEGRR